MKNWVNKLRLQISQILFIRLFGGTHQGFQVFDEKVAEAIAGALEEVFEIKTAMEVNREDYASIILYNGIGLIWPKPNSKIPFREIKDDGKLSLNHISILTDNPEQAADAFILHFDEYYKMSGACAKMTIIHNRVVIVSLPGRLDAVIKFHVHVEELPQGGIQYFKA